MMLLASPATKFLTHVGHFGDHSRNQRRFARCPISSESVPHSSGIRIWISLSYKPCVGVSTNEKRTCCWDTLG